jgi:hypothetical protein
MQTSEEEEYEAKLAALRNAIEEGDASGIAEGNVVAHVRERLNLPAKGQSAFGPEDSGRCAG